VRLAGSVSCTCCQRLSCIKPAFAGCGIVPDCEDPQCARLRRPHVGELLRAKERRNGKEMLQNLCARCHSVGRTGASPNRLAPPFRTFSETTLYDCDFMQRLQHGLTSVHPFMPTFRFNRDNAEEVLNYIKSIQEAPKPK